MWNPSSDPADLKARPHQESRTSKALLRLFTTQYLGVAIFIDLFTLNEQVRRANAQVASGARA